MLITGIGSISAFSAAQPNTTIAAAGTSDFTTRVKPLRLKICPRFEIGFSFENFNPIAFG